MKDTLVIGGHEFQSRFILGSGKYSLDLINAAVQNAGAQIITLALRRANEGGTANILDYIPEGVTLLPNTSGARNADEAVRIARLSRACGCGDFVKIEIMRDSKYLLPDNQETIRATEILAKEGFVVMPYMYPDLNVARDLVNAGAASIMPLAAPIGTKDQKIHSGQFSTKVLFPLANWVRTLSMPYLNRTAVNATLKAVLTTSRILLAFSERRSGSKERLTSSPSRAASAAARSVIRTNTATTSSSVNDQD